MKRWEMVARALGCTEAYARSECIAFDQNYLSEMDTSPVAPPAPDLGRDIAIAILIAGSKASHDHWIDVWTRLTGRAKEGE